MNLYIPTIDNMHRIQNQIDIALVWLDCKIITDFEMEIDLLAPIETNILQISELVNCIFQNQMYFAVIDFSNIIYNRFLSIACIISKDQLLLKQLVLTRQQIILSQKSDTVQSVSAQQLEVNIRRAGQLYGYQPTAIEAFIRQIVYKEINQLATSNAIQSEAISLKGAQIYKYKDRILIWPNIQYMLNKRYSCAHLHEELIQDVLDCDLLQKHCAKLIIDYHNAHYLRLIKRQHFSKNNDPDFIALNESKTQIQQVLNQLIIDASKY